MRLDPALLGFARHPDLPPLVRPALLVVDCQRAFVEPGGPAAAAGAGPAVVAQLRLVAACLAAGIPVAATRHAHRRPPAPGGMGSWWSSFLLEGDPAAELCPELRRALRPGDPVVAKESYSAFRETRLAEILAGWRIRTLLIAGFLTHICVDTTARDAFQLGLDVIVAADACASRHVELHRAALLCLSNACCRIFETEDLIVRIDAGGR